DPVGRGRLAVAADRDDRSDHGGLPSSWLVPRTVRRLARTHTRALRGRTVLPPPPAPHRAPELLALPLPERVAGEVEVHVVDHAGPPLLGRRCRDVDHSSALGTGVSRQYPPSGIKLESKTL